MVDKTALFAYSVSCLNKVADALVRVSSGACAGFLPSVVKHEQSSASSVAWRRLRPEACGPQSF